MQALCGEATARRLVDGARQAGLLDEGKLLLGATPLPVRGSKGDDRQGRCLLDNPDKLRKELKKNWKTHCKALCDFEEVEEHLSSFTFPEFKVVSGGEIVADLKGTSIYPVFFGGGLSKPRPPAKPPPTAISSDELGYVNALVDAYDEHCEDGIVSPEAALGHQRYGPHLRTSRKEFYCAGRYVSSARTCW